jgi:XTP/dITP diphosphohydrolase
MVLVDPWGEGGDREVIAEGSCEGMIARQPRGGGGFGYDPLFVVAGQGGRTMAELADDEKNQISHRACAAAALRPALEAVIARLLAASAI